MTHVTCRLTAKNRDQLRDPTLGNRVGLWAAFLSTIGLAIRSRDAVGKQSQANCSHPSHRAYVHQAAKLVAAVLRVAEVTAGLAGSNGSLPPGL